MANSKEGENFIRPVTPNNDSSPLDGTNLTPEEQIARLGVDSEGAVAQAIRLGGRATKIENPLKPPTK